MQKTADLEERQRPNRLVHGNSEDKYVLEVCKTQAKDVTRPGGVQNASQICRLGHAVSPPVNLAIVAPFWPVKRALK